MNIFHKITRKSLGKNRTRTIVTIIGIILSMALFTAVIEGAYSGVQFLLRSEIAQSGAYHGYYYNATKELADELVKRDDMQDYATWQVVGWSKTEDEASYKPYLAVISISDNFPDLVSIKMIAGRMPESENEIIVPDNLQNTSGKTYDVGNTIEISIGKRMADGYEAGLYESFYSDEEEEITDTREQTYTIVGAYQSLDYNTSPGAAYPLLTKGAANGEVNVFFTLKDISQFYKEFADNQPLEIPYTAHGDLVLYHGLSRDDNLMTVLYGFVTILVLLISFGSISLIYNSFAISVSERTKQFGILKSIGATKKQIRQSVLYEAFVLSGIGIPLGLVVGCTGIGITLRCLQDDFARLVNYGDTTVKIGLVLNPAALIAAAIVCLVTVLISAWIPAKRSAKVNAIEAIRQVDDMKIKGREVKTTKLTEKLFGFEGMMATKNFKRNKKRYRSTIISLFLSIVLFISATSFCSYLTNAIQGVGSSVELTDIYSYFDIEDDWKEDPDDLLELLSSAAGVTDGLYMNCSFAQLCANESNLAGTFINRPQGLLYEVFSNSGTVFFGNLVFVNDAAFRSLCEENHLNMEDYFDKAHPTGIIFNQGVEQYQEPEGESRKWYSYQVLNESKLPCVLSEYTVRSYDGYHFQSFEEGADGSTILVYYPAEYINEWWNSNDGSIPLDESMAMKMPAEEALIVTEFTVNAVIKNTLFALTSDTPAVIFPYSMEKTVLDEAYEYYNPYVLRFDFRSENHKQTYMEMEELLQNNGMNSHSLFDVAEVKEAQKTVVSIVKVFAYGFIVLISLIAIANVFNTISTNIGLRRREFAMLKSVGLSERGFRKMMNYECIIYGLRGVMYGLPVSFLVTYAIYKVAGSAFETAFYIPWHSVVIAVGSVFVVVFATMLYATRKIRNDNPIDALKNENI